MTDPTPPAPPSPSASPSGGRRGVWVVYLLLLASTAIAGAMVGHYRSANQYLQKEREKIRVIGADRDVEGCVDEILVWHAHCMAPRSLCKQTTESMMGICLSGRSRDDYCEALGDETRSTRFGFEECEARQLDRAGNGICAKAYTTIASFCMTTHPTSGGNKP